MGFALPHPPYKSDIQNAVRGELVEPRTALRQAQGERITPYVRNTDEDRLEFGDEVLSRARSCLSPAPAPLVR